ncbi:protein PFC0760c-like isoform X2 [Maniola hyperantus]
MSDVCDLIAEPQLCPECAHRLTKCDTFKNKALRAHSALIQLLLKDKIITLQGLKSVDREGNLLTSAIIKDIFKPDHYDLYVMHNEEDNNTTKKENIVRNSQEKSNSKRKKIDETKYNRKKSRIGKEKVHLSKTGDINNDFQVTNNVINIDHKLHNRNIASQVIIYEDKMHGDVNITNPDKSNNDKIVNDKRDVLIICDSDDDVEFVDNNDTVHDMKCHDIDDDSKRNMSDDIDSNINDDSKRDMIDDIDHDIDDDVRRDVIDDDDDVSKCNMSDDIDHDIDEDVGRDMIDDIDHDIDDDIRCDVIDDNYDVSKCNISDDIDRDIDDDVRRDVIDDDDDVSKCNMSDDIDEDVGRDMIDDIDHDIDDDIGGDMIEDTNHNIDNVSECNMTDDIDHDIDDDIEHGHDIDDDIAHDIDSDNIDIDVDPDIDELLNKNPSSDRLLNKLKIGKHSENQNQNHGVNNGTKCKNKTAKPKNYKTRIVQTSNVSKEVIECNIGTNNQNEDNCTNINNTISNSNDLSGAFIEIEEVKEIVKNKNESNLIKDEKSSNKRTLDSAPKISKRRSKRDKKT